MDDETPNRVTGLDAAFVALVTVLLARGAGALLGLPQIVGTAAGVGLVWAAMAKDVPDQYRRIGLAAIAPADSLRLRLRELPIGFLPVPPPEAKDAPEPK